MICSMFYWQSYQVHYAIHIYALFIHMNSKIYIHHWNFLIDCPFSIANILCHPYIFIVYQQEFNNQYPQLKVQYPLCENNIALCNVQFANSILQHYSLKWGHAFPFKHDRRMIKPQWIYVMTLMSFHHEDRITKKG